MDHSDRLPQITWVRYLFGTAVMAIVLAGFYVVLIILWLLRPHYRRVWPLYREYAKDVWHSIINRERFFVGK